MGKSKKDALRVNFDKTLKLEFHGTKVTSDAGLLAYRELDEALGLTTMIESDFSDNRKGRNTQHNLIALLRQSIYGRLAGYEDTNDAERLSVDPAMRQVVGSRAKERTAASTSLMGRFETCANRIRLMLGIDEKLDFMTGRAVKVYAKAWIGRKAEHKNPGILVNL